jgi:hypothetical protein
LFGDDGNRRALLNVHERALDPSQRKTLASGSAGIARHRMSSMIIETFLALAERSGIDAEKVSDLYC